MAHNHDVALVVDNDGYMRMAFHHLLKERLGFAVVRECETLQEAQEILSEGGIKLAVVRLGISDFRSISELEGIRTANPDLKIAVTTKAYRKEDIVSALDVNANGVVPLDIGVKMLFTAFQQIVAGFSYWPAPVDAKEEVVVGHELLDKLTGRQVDILKLLKNGLATKEIANKLQLAEGTVKIHLKALFRVLKVNNRASAAVIGAKLFDREMAAMS